MITAKLTAKEKAFEALMRTSIGAKMIAKNIYSKALAYVESQPHEPIEVVPFFLINDDIKKIKMVTYIQCEVSKDYRPLVLAGEPRESDLKEAWHKIQLQKNDATKDSTVTGYAKLTGQIQELAIHIANVENVCAAFKIQYDERFVERLREMGYDFPFTHDSYMDNLKIVSNQLVGHTIKLEELKADHERIYPKDEAKELTEDDYMNTIDEIIAWRKLAIAPTVWAEQNTVYDYCIALGKLRAYAEKLNEEMNKE